MPLYPSRFCSFFTSSDSRRRLYISPPTPTTYHSFFFFFNFSIPPSISPFLLLPLLFHLCLSRSPYLPFSLPHMQSSHLPPSLSFPRALCSLAFFLSALLHCASFGSSARVGLAGLRGNRPDASGLGTETINATGDSSTERNKTFSARSWHESKIQANRIRELLAAGRSRYVNARPERMGEPGSCSMDDIAIFQGETGPLPDGIPSFTVQIFNLCLGGCAMANIHVSCGWFASATLVNPKLFKRLAFDDCIVNNGKPLRAGDSLTFHYSNSFQYPFSVANAVHDCGVGH